MNAILIVSVAWVVLLFATSGIPAFIANLLPARVRETALYGLSCTMCLGFYVGYIWGIFAYGIRDIEHCAVLSFQVSSTALLNRTAYQLIVLVNSWVETRLRDWSNNELL